MTKIKDFTVDEEGKCTYMNNKTNEIWPKWKLWKELTDKEKEQINLATFPKESIIFDFDLGQSEKEEIPKEEIMKKYSEIMEPFKKDIKYFISWLSAHGFHIQANFTNMKELTEELCTEIRKIYIQKYNADLAKASRKTAISLPNRPHHKNNIVYGIIENFEGENKVPEDIIILAENNINSRKKFQENLSSNLTDEFFKDYFTKDKLWKYLQTREDVIPLGTSRNNILLKNLAIAAAKSGKSREEIQNLIGTMMKRIMPDIPYQVFDGWYRAALQGKYPDYNMYEINKWIFEYSNEIDAIYEISIAINNTKLDKNVIKLIRELETLNKYIILENKDEYIEKIKKIKDSFIKEYLIGILASKLFIKKERLIRELTPTPEAIPISIFNMIEKECIKCEYYIDKILPKKQTILIGGKGGQGKSLIVLALCLALKKKDKFLGKYDIIEDPSILWFDLENGEIRNQTRSKYLLDKLELKENCKPFNFIHGFDKNHVEKELEKCKNYDLIVFDSFRRFLEGSENDSEVTNKFYINFLKPLAEMGKTIIIIHHLKKIKLSDAEDEDLLDAFRGSGDIVNQFDSVFLLSRGTESVNPEGTITNFDVFLNLGIKNRDGNPIQNIAMNIIKDDTINKTKIEYLGDKKMSSPKEKIKKAIIEFLTEHPESKRETIVNEIGRQSGATIVTIDRYLKEMLAEFSVKCPRYGFYSVD